MVLTEPTLHRIDLVNSSKLGVVFHRRPPTTLAQSGEQRTLSSLTQNQTQGMTTIYF